MEQINIRQDSVPISLCVWVLLLIKVKIDSAIRTELREISDIYQASIVDLAPESMMIELTGTTQKIDAFLQNLRNYTILEMCRTGVTALERDSVKPATEKIN